MEPLVWALGLGIVGCGATSCLFGVWYLRHRKQVAQLDLVTARELFQRRREWLEARFFTLASQSGKPRGLTWSDCHFRDEFVVARDRVSGELRVFVGITIRFEAIEGGGMEDNPNVSNLRDATAVFRYENREWVTDGRVVFNLSPTQTIERFHHDLEWSG